MKEQFKGRTFKQLVVIYYFTVALCIGLGLYSLYTGSTIGGTLYGRYGGVSSVSYGANGFFIIAACLLAGGAFVWLITRSSK